MNKELIAIFEYLEREKGIKRDVIVKAIENALAASAQKAMPGSPELSVSIDPRTGVITATSQKEVVETVVAPKEEISIKDALEIDPECELEQIIEVPVDPKMLGRIAAQKAKQIINQKIRTAERDVICEEYRHRINEIVSGTIKRKGKGGDLVVDLGKVEALLPVRQYPSTERYREGEKVLALLLEVRDLPEEAAEVILSRSSEELVRQLFIQEVPEVNDGTVVIKTLVREAGYRTKVAVESNDYKVDPVGTCIGVRGTRIKNIIRELNNEKIDVIPHSNNSVEFLQNIMAPVEIKKIGVNESETAISIVVDDADIGTVLGKKGMNTRLTAKLLGKELEVRRLSEYKKALELERKALAENEDPALDEHLQIKGFNKMILENIIDAGFDTKRKLLLASPEELANIPGIEIEMAENLLEEIIKQKG
jgi:transcription termination/antitermination protein NusA